MTNEHTKPDQSPGRTANGIFAKLASALETRMANKVILAASAVFCIAGIAVAYNVIPRQNEFLAGLFLGVSVVCLLPWLVLVRRKLFKTRPAASQRWMRVVTVLLVIALLVGPLATASSYLSLKVAEPTDAWGDLHRVAVHIVIALSSHSAGLVLCIIAFLIQLWRDQWRKVLNVLAISYQLLAYLLAYLFLCRING